MDLFDKFQMLSGLHRQIIESGADPFGVCLGRVCSATEAVIDGRKVVLAGTNNYLGLTFHPECVQAVHGAVAAEGTGTTGSRIANGTYASHCALERELAAFLNHRLAIMFTTGYQANLSVLSGLAGPDDFIFIDADAHASIYDGCRLSTATVIRFRHNDPADLENRLKRLDSSHSNKLIVVEGIYSMFGDRAPLAEIARLKRKYNAYLMVDEAHSLGVLGAHGRGLAEEADVEKDVDFIVGTFSKSLGAIGGFCTSNHPELEFLRLTSRPYMYTASLSPSNVASVSAALRLLQSTPELRTRLRRNAQALYDGLSATGFRIFARESPIIAVKATDRAEAVRLWNSLLAAGVYVNLALPPGTPHGVSLLRCSVSAAHTDEQIQQICDAFTQAVRGLKSRGSSPSREAHSGGPGAKRRPSSVKCAASIQAPEKERSGQKRVALLPGRKTDPHP